MTFLFVQCIIKQLLDSVFVISKIIKVSIRVIRCFKVFHFFFSLDQGAEKDAKLATFQEKRNAIVLVLRNCLEKLENLRAKGAANDMREVKEQQNIVKVNTWQ